MPSIKFTLESSRDAVSFLDVWVQKDGGKLSTSVYRKPTDRNNFLHFSSYHPPGLKRSLPYSQLLRTKRICSSEVTYERQANDLCDRFKTKGYTSKLLHMNREKAQSRERSGLLTPKPLVKGASRPVLASTYSPLCQDTKEAVKKHWHLLSTDPQVGHVFKDTPMFAHKRAKNVRDSLVRSDCWVPPSHFMSEVPSGNFPCHNCVHCNAMIKGGEYLHPQSGKKLKVKGTITCKTKYVVYMLKCPCGLCYIGKTKRELKLRISEHKSNIRNNDERSPVARHFNEKGHKVCSLRFQGIEMVAPLRRGGDRDNLLLRKEAWHIHHLETEHPKGLNEELLLGCYL